jgi:predicted Zn-dependent protease
MAQMRGKKFGLFSTASNGSMHCSMTFRKVAIVTLVVLSSFAANTVAPSKSELESMYDKAFRAFDANNFAEALQQLDAIDARQPDLAESQNLRGVIFMRQGIYDKAEAALYRAVELDPKFWNARFNLAEIPFLQKNWSESRNRFQALLSSNSAELQGEATQLIQYKILLTYILEGKDNMVDSFLSKFELSSDTPAVQYGNAAIALQHKDEKAAKEWIAAAQKNFSPQLNKLFAESLYEAGWLQKPAGQTRAALELTSAAERTARTKAFAKQKFDQAQDAFQKRDLTKALRLLDEVEAADPNQPAYANLRGEILMEQKNFDQAEALFRKALKTDPKLREAQFNLAQIPFKKKEYSKARDRLEALFASTPGGDKNQAAQLIRFKIFMTLLLEGKESRAQKMMDQFQFTGDTPALYYAQAAWEFKHNNAEKANDWITSARKIYSLALNLAFADSLADAGWVQNPAVAEEVASSKTIAQADSTLPTGTGPGIEPSPIPGSAPVENPVAKETAPSIAPSASPVIAGMEATTSSAEISPLPAPTASTQTAAVAPTVEKSPAPIVEPPVARTEPEKKSLPEEKPKVAPTAPPVTQPSSAPVVAAAKANSSPAVVAAKPTSSPVVAVAKPASTPATVLAPAQVREFSPAGGERLNSFRTLLVTSLLVAGIAILAWVIVPELRRRLAPSFRPVAPAAPATGPSFQDTDVPGLSVNAEATPPRHRFTGGPPKRSVQLKATEPSVRRAVFPTGKAGRAVAATPVEATPPAPPVHEPEFAEPIAEEIEYTEAEVITSTEQTVEPITYAPEPFEAASAMAQREGEFEPIGQGQPVPYQTAGITPEFAAPEVIAPEPEVIAHEPEVVVPAKKEPVIEAPPIEVVASRPAEAAPVSPPVISTEPALQQSTTPVTMPEPTPTPAARTTAGAPAPAPAQAGMHTGVQITFSCEIASLQLTPTFKMGALQLRPVSKVVMMRLSPAQHPQPAMNLQVTFEVATVQAAGGGFGTIRLTPSQQQKPGTITSPAFTIAGVQLVANSESAPVQLTPSQQGKASVLMTAAFQISTVEFSPSFEISSIVLNASSKNASVQLPGAGPSAIEGAPVFEIANMQVGGNGEIGLIQLNPPGGTRRA